MKPIGLNKIAGGKQQLSGEIDGGSIRPLFNDPVNGVVKRPLEAIIFHHPGKLSSAIRQGAYKLYVTWNQNGKMNSRYLFNLEAEIVENENTNIADSNVSRADQMQNMLFEYLHSVEAKDPTTILEYLPGSQRKATPLPALMSESRSSQIGR